MMQNGAKWYKFLPEAILVVLKGAATLDHLWHAHSLTIDTPWNGVLCCALERTVKLGNSSRNDLGIHIQATFTYCIKATVPPAQTISRLYAIIILSVFSSLYSHLSLSPSSILSIVGGIHIGHFSARTSGPCMVYMSFQNGLARGHETCWNSGTLRDTLCLNTLKLSNYTI